MVLLEHAEAIITGAERAGYPVILQISENAVRYRGSLAPLALATLRLAEDAGVPVCVHLDHATDADLVREAVGLGITSVMYDASALPYEINLSATAELAAWCHDRGVAIEAELGEVGGKDGVHAPGARTDPDDAARFVEETSVDSLAVAVGSSHAMIERHAALDDVLIAELSAAVSVPLVLHGSSGVPDQGLRSAVTAGISKVNIATHLNVLMSAQVREVLIDEKITDPRKYLGPGRAVMADEVERLLGLFAKPCAQS